MDPLFVGAVFLAGMLMFLAPCTLPMLPAYLGFISGVTEEELAHPDTKLRARWLVVRNGINFSAGFSAVFILMGLLASFAGAALTPVREVLTTAGGVIIIMFGLFMLGVLKLPWLAQERRFQLPGFLTVGKPCSACLLGGAFAFGWTPCIGPILGTVLLFAGSSDTLVSGIFLLLVFSLGFSVPFILLAALIGEASRFIKFMGPYLHAVSLVGGVVLILIGISVAFGDSVLTRWFFDLFSHIDFEHVLLPYL